MKRLLIILALLLAGMAGTAEAKHRPVSVGVSFFYSSLSPYGEWIQSDFGYAWRPMHVMHGWRPYMVGSWVWTDYGWYWVSEEPFGWATFHYGRWAYDDYYGWIWVPDDVWGPSWVEWRYNDDYIGWAPLSPYAGFSLNIGIVYRDRWMAPVHYWNFVPCRYFTSTRVVDYVQPVDRARRIFGVTRGSVDIRSEDHRIVNRGIDVGFVERRTSAPVQRLDVVTRDRGNGDRIVRESNRQRLEVYRPRLDDRAPEVGRDRRGGETEMPPSDTRQFRQPGNRDLAPMERTAPDSRRNDQPQQGRDARVSPQSGWQREQENAERRQMQQRGADNRMKEQQREQWQQQRQEQQMRERQMRDNRSRDAFQKPERTQTPQLHQAPPPPARREPPAGGRSQESRGGRDRGRRP